MPPKTLMQKHHTGPIVTKFKSDKLKSAQRTYGSLSARTVYINENDDGDVGELEMVKKMKEMLQMKNPDVQQLTLYWRKTFQLRRLFIRNIEEHSIEAVLDEYPGFNPLRTVGYTLSHLFYIRKNIVNPH
ncbi:unnamed protein product [Didymodactylos carnosus]|uniref:Uncharacterized protein n=1 Tax=Didymodactylos carnosus TaxID=1234261 RepID=A0A814VUV5_9BILA|nr:unnamed protein product [Didymodactylos carnosus]CAF1612517.1 unnamed protein product [Didymodactylos carnosus]CAF3957893.1 unnamed protein product [Didymodactylos carnosus]CAF4427195.1 unnamed protein product [Didymodactylos carnosus]